MKLETKLHIARASNNALKEEIKGLQLYINKLHKELGKDPLFKKGQDGK